MNNFQIEVPNEWEQLNSENFHGVILVVGGTDTGKSTFARYLQGKIITQGRRVALLDGDPGQGILGPPTTINMVTWNTRDDRIEKRGRKQWFVGSTSPRRHMLPMVVGGWRLVEAAYQSGADCVVYDTTGLVEPSYGGLALKLAIIDLLRPNVVVALQREGELDPLLKPLRRFERLKLIELHPTNFVVERSQSIRQRNRARRYGDYFAKAREQILYWPKKAVVPGPRFSRNRLLGLEGQDGHCLGLAIVVENDQENRQIKLLTPVDNFDRVEVLRIGDVSVNPYSYQDELIF